MIGALGTQADIDLTLAVAAAMTPEQRAEWRDGHNCLPTGEGSGPNYDAYWLTDLINDTYPEGE